MIFNNIHQWIFLFYIYCFMGWIWESSYVSIEKHKWVNRGFLRGPFLPIYGLGAIVVLLSTMAIKSNIILIFIIGMISATILEYITGALMEKIFHVRYWDYSENLCNINGHICLISSLAWGVFSIILVKFANPPIASFVRFIPNEIIEICTYIITIFITIDCVHAFNEAMDLKNVLIKITERNEIVAHIKKRLEVVEAFANDDVKSIYEKISQYIAKFDSLSSKANDEKNYLKDEFFGYLNKLTKHESSINNIESKVYINCINILNRNPNAKSKKYEEAMREVRNLDNESDEK